MYDLFSVCLCLDYVIPTIIEEQKVRSCSPLFVFSMQILGILASQLPVQKRKKLHFFIDFIDNY